ncbi:hypothetical protein LXL04_020438 [Taraxacum kok-saghyz]
MGRIYCFQVPSIPNSSSFVSKVVTAYHPMIVSEHTPISGNRFHPTTEGSSSNCHHLLSGDSFRSLGWYPDNEYHVTVSGSNAGDARDNAKRKPEKCISISRRRLPGLEYRGGSEQEDAVSVLGVFLMLRWGKKHKRLAKTWNSVDFIWMQLPFMLINLWCGVLCTIFCCRGHFCHCCQLFFVWNDEGQNGLIGFWNYNEIWSQWLFLDFEFVDELQGISMAECSKWLFQLSATVWGSSIGSLLLWVLGDFNNRGQFGPSWLLLFLELQDAKDCKRIHLYVVGCYCCPRLKHLKWRKRLKRSSNSRFYVGSRSWWCIFLSSWNEDSGMTSFCVCILRADWDHLCNKIVCFYYKISPNQCFALFVGKKVFLWHKKDDLGLKEEKVLNFVKKWNFIMLIAIWDFFIIKFLDFFYKISPNWWKKLDSN